MPNSSISPSRGHLEEVKNICDEIRNLSYVDTVVVDTEIKSDFLRMDLAKEIAK